MGMYYLLLVINNNIFRRYSTAWNHSLNSSLVLAPFLFLSLLIWHFKLNRVFWVLLKQYACCERCFSLVWVRGYWDEYCWVTRKVNRYVGNFPMGTWENTLLSCWFWLLYQWRSASVLCGICFFCKIQHSCTQACKAH